MKFREIPFWIIALLLIAGNSTILPSRPEIRESPGKHNSTCDFDTIRTDLNQYIWPTDASTRITSSFAEYRTKHFHGGIDISTNGQTGYKVFAVRDGYVYRIWITPNGYGKMLFIKHPDGYVSTYAHLKGFNPKINEAVMREQYRQGTYAIDLLLDSAQVQVKQGEIVAYTGDTGFGPPHLHFEIRDENLNPVNPLLSQNFAVVDNIPPFIRRIMITPLGYGSTIDHQSSPKYYSRLPRRASGLIIPQSIRVHGQIGFCIDAEDRANGSWGKTGIHSMEMYLDDSLYFAMQLNRIPQYETKQIDLVYDLHTLLEGHGKFQKLYIDKGNSLPFFNHKPEGTGIVNTENLSEGEHRYRIIAEDISGNRTTLQGTIIANHSPAIEIAEIKTDEIVIKGDRLDEIDKFYLFGKRAFQPNWSQHTLAKGRFDFDGKNISLPINARPYDVIKIIGVTKLGSESPPIYRFIKKSFGAVRDIHIQTEVMPDYVLITLTTPGVFTETPELKIQEGTSIRSVIPKAIDLNKYEAVFYPSDKFNGVRNIKTNAEVNGKPSSSSSEIIVYSIPPDRSGSFACEDGKITISYDSGAVFKPLYLQLKSESDQHGSSYDLTPSDILLNRGIKITVPVTSDFRTDHTGIYYRSNSGWIFQNSEIDKNTSSLSATITRTLGEIALFNDDLPPSFGRLRLFPSGGKIKVSFRYHDNLSGVDTDKIKMYIDDTLVIPEIDGEHRIVWYQSGESLARGKHTLSITMKDRMNNEAELKKTFSIR